MKGSRHALRVALPKGKVQAEVLDLLRRAGFRSVPTTENNRLLRFTDGPHRTTFYFVRDRDIPTLVEFGACEIGIVGKDVLLEQERDVYEPLDLGVGRCRLVWAGPGRIRNTLRRGRGRTRARSGDVSNAGGRVATQYPRLTSRYFESKGHSVEVIELYGSIEVAPALGLADTVVDLVATGHTLRSMGLVEIETIRDISTWVILNRTASKLRATEITDWLQRLDTVVRA